MSSFNTRMNAIHEYNFGKNKSNNNTVSSNGNINYMNNTIYYNASNSGTNIPDNKISTNIIIRSYTGNGLSR